MLGIPAVVWFLGAAVAIVAIYFLCVRKLGPKPGETDVSTEARS